MTRIKQMALWATSTVVAGEIYQVLAKPWPSHHYHWVAPGLDEGIGLGNYLTALAWVLAARALGRPGPAVGLWGGALGGATMAWINGAAPSCGFEAGALCGLLAGTVALGCNFLLRMVMKKGQEEHKRQSP